MNQQYQEIIDKIITELTEIKKVNLLIEKKNILFKKYIDPLYSQLKSLPNEEKKEFGKSLNLLKNTINEKIDGLIKAIEVENNKNIVNYDINIPCNKVIFGQKHPLNLVLEEIADFFAKLNFVITSGDDVTDVKYNFEILNIPKSHPSWSKQDTFYINEKTILRCHCTASSAQSMDKNKADSIKVLSYGSVYRNDDDDPTHSHQFNQIDLIWIEKNLTINNLKWLIDGLLKHLFGNDTKTRYRLSQFPFTEPSFEVDICCHNCKGKGCNICKQSGWIEVLGAGMLHQNVFRNAKINHTTGLAAGIGLERIAMLKYGINDIRDFYNNDFRFLNQFKGGK